MGKILAILGSAQVLVSAVIAAVVSLIVARLTTRRERRARGLEEAKRRLKIVRPVLQSLVEDSFYQYVGKNREILRENRDDFPQDMQPLIDKALKEYFGAGMSFMSEDDEKKVRESQKKLKEIAGNLLSPLTEERDRLQAIVNKETGF